MIQMYELLAYKSVRSLEQFSRLHQQERKKKPSHFQN